MDMPHRRIDPFINNQTPFQTKMLSPSHENVCTIADLFDRVREDAARYAKGDQPQNRHDVYKRHLLSYLKNRCGNAHVNFAALQREKVIRVSGEFPKQTLTLLDPTRPRQARPVPNLACVYNKGLSEEMAFDQAIEASVTQSGLSLIPPPDSVRQCPLSKAPLLDPVCTIHGQVYERRYIEAWFKHNRTDLLTGERLLTTTLF